MSKKETIDSFARLERANKKWLLKNKTKYISMNDIINSLITKARLKAKK